MLILVTRCMLRFLASSKKLLEGQDLELEGPHSTGVAEVG